MSYEKQQKYTDEQKVGDICCTVTEDVNEKTENRNIQDSQYWQT